MNPRIASRISSAVILGLALSLATHYNAVRRNEMGKSAFEVSQAQRFDKFYAKPHDPTAPATLLAGVYVSSAFLGIYELLAFGIYLGIKPKGSASGT
jgi:hypothetical protein